MNGIRRKIEVLANCATIVLAIIMSVALVRAFILRPNGVVGAPGIPVAKVGDSLKRALPINYDKHKATLVLAISTHCHFCAESVPFFQKLQERVGQDIAVAVVLPETVAEGQKYLAEKEIRAGEVRQVSLAGLGVGGTPTILLVDASGIVRNIWIGKLDSDGEEKVLTVLAGWPSRSNS
ncbi:MAG TPA: hypothetical protein VHW24_05950 [Bryobacteraceae bacterium]|jgi:hypothetical protein|nr:hypothetical protein [Bryobacteraceae bacterium]